MGDCNGSVSERSKICSSKSTDSTCESEIQKRNCTSQCLPGKGLLIILNLIMYIPQTKFVRGILECLVIWLVGQLLLNCYPFPTYRRILTHLQQTSFGNIVPKGDIAQNKLCLLLPQCFQLFSIIKPLFTFLLIFY